MHPLQRECDPQNPKQFAAWCWAGGIPDPSPVRPEPIPLIGPVLVESVSQMLWDFGFRHHPDKQTKWINGTAGLVTVAEVSEEEPEEDPFQELAKEFLSDNNPKLLEAVRKIPEKDRGDLLQKLEKNFSELTKLIEALKEAEDGRSTGWE